MNFDLTRVILSGVFVRQSGRKRSRGIFISAMQRAVGLGRAQQTSRIVNVFICL
jgi:hypothetical protein